MSNWKPVPTDGIFPQDKASAVPRRSSSNPILAALRKLSPGFCIEPFALKARNCPEDDRQSVASTKCSGRIILPVSETAELRSCTSTKALPSNIYPIGYRDIMNIIRMTAFPVDHSHYSKATIHKDTPKCSSVTAFRHQNPQIKFSRRPYRRLG
nr:hypothetical protein Iba_chr15fCG0360 [Ipomoea batatas]